jgi:putative sugar O-methyltransferase
VRSTLDTRRGRTTKFILERVWPFSAVFAAQVALTRGYARDEVALLAARMSESDTARDLVNRYKITNSLLGGCVAAARIGAQEYALHHIRTVQLIDQVRRHVELDGVRAMFEIGGGFGASVQLLLENFASVRKVVYLDVVPNLYVGTCYLRTLFGDAVRDFSETSSLNRIGFRDDDALEILAVAPWQIERLDLSIDLFWNANSFVEMPREVVSNYARHVMRLEEPGLAAVVLATYGGGGPDTLPVEELPTFFPGRDFLSDRYRALDHPSDHRLDDERDASWDTYLFVSPGKHGAQTAPSTITAQTSAPG